MWSCSMAAFVLLLFELILQARGVVRYQEFGGLAPRGVPKLRTLEEMRRCPSRSIYFSRLGSTPPLPDLG